MWVGITPTYLNRALIRTALSITHVGSFDTVHNISYDIAEDTMQVNHAGKVDQSDHESMVHKAPTIKEDRAMGYKIPILYDHKKELETRPRAGAEGCTVNSRQRAEAVRLASRVPTSLNLRPRAVAKKPARELRPEATRETTKAPNSSDIRPRILDIYSTPPPDADSQELLNSLLSSSNPSPNRKLHTSDMPPSVIEEELPAGSIDGSSILPSYAEGDEMTGSGNECAKYFPIPTKNSPAYNKLPHPAEEEVHLSTIGSTSRPTPEPQHTMWTRRPSHPEGQDLANSNNSPNNCHPQLDSLDASSYVMEEELAIGSIDIEGDQTPESGSGCAKDTPILTKESPAYNKLPPAEDGGNPVAIGNTSAPTPEPQHTMWTRAVQTTMLTRGVQMEQDGSESKT